MLRVKLVRSLIGQVPRNRKTAQALGLKRVGDVALHRDHPAIRGMIHKVQHMVEVEVVEDGAGESPKPKAARPAEAGASRTEEQS